MKLEIILTILFLKQYHQDLNLGHVNYLSPQEAEDQYMNTLQNHKDDEFIYGLGLIGQDNPTLEKQIKINFSELKHICNILQVFGRYFNVIEKDVPFENAQDEEDLDILHDFKIISHFLKVIVESGHEIQEEVENFYQNIIIFELDLNTLLNILDLQYYYNQLVEKFDKKDPQFLKIKREMELVTYEFQSKMKYLLRSVDILRDFNTYIVNLLDPYSKEFLEDEPKNVFYKVDKSIEMMNQIFSIKSRLEYFSNQIEQGYQQFFTIRSNLIYLMTKFKNVGNFKLIDTDNKTSNLWNLCPYILLSIIYFLFQIILINDQNIIKQIFTTLVDQGVYK